MDKELYKLIYEIEKSHWWYVSRRLIIKRLCKQIFLNGGRVLDVGCGTGGTFSLFSQFSTIEGIDCSMEAVKYCHKRGYTLVQQGVAERLPYDDNCIDVITALDVIEHLDNDLLALKEMKRVLKIGGYIILTVPAYKFLWSQHDIVTHHKQRYIKKLLIQKMTFLELEINKISYFNFFLFSPILIYRKLSNNLNNKTVRSNLGIPTKLENFIFGSIFKSERFILPYINLPFGVSIICIAKKTM